MDNILSIEYYNQLLDSLSTEKNNLMNNIIPEFTISTFTNLNTQEEIENILKIYSEDYQTLAKEIHVYLTYYNNERIYVLFQKNLDLLKKTIEDKLNTINILIQKQNKEINQKMENIDLKTKKIEEIEDIIFNKLTLTLEDYQKISDFIIEMNLPNSLELSIEVAKYLISTKNTISKEDTHEIEEIIDYANSIYQKLNLSELEQSYTKEELEELSNHIYDDETIKLAVLKEIIIIQDKEIKKEDLLLHRKELDRLYNMYLQYQQVMQIYNNIQISKEKLGHDLYTMLSSEELADLLSIETKIKKDPIEYCNDVGIEKLNKLYLTLNSRETNNAIPIKSFIIFASDKDNKPFIIPDLIEGKMIDKSATGADSKEYKTVVSTLFYDLLTIGNPRYLDSIDTSTQTNSSKIMNPVYYVTNGNVNRNKKTDLWRIRPNRSSSVRYIERKVILKPNTTIYNQITSLLKKHLPNIQIDETEDFTLSINYSTGVKRQDVDMYTSSIKRYEEDEMQIISLLFRDGNLKTELTGEELMSLGDIILRSIDTYNQIRNIDPTYDFEYIDTMLGGGPKYGK